MKHWKDLRRLARGCLGGWILWQLGLGPLDAGQTLQLHPQNPHYFLFRGRPTLIITSGEHYGAVLNLDFDYLKYLDTLAKARLNGTRTWVGAYCEQPAAFGISQNTLAPKPDRFICPWPRSQQPGYQNGGNRFDLTRWDDRYFDRLKDVVREAGRRRIVVEINLFCPFYEEGMWRLSPMNVINNANQVGEISRTNVYTLDKNGDLLHVQEAMVRKVVTELNRFDNVYYEICNEPYFGGVTSEWQQHIAEVIVETEKGLRRRHLISQNIANEKARVENPNPAISIFNFHYASPPDAVAMNYDLNKVIGDNETGFRGNREAPYRMEAWDFIIAGGGLFNNLDYSFSAGHEDGTFELPPSEPGGGSPTLRRQLRFLAELMRGFDFVRMRPCNGVVVGGVPAGMTARVLAKPGRDYLVYLRPVAVNEGVRAGQARTFADGELMLDVSLPRGQFNAEWFDPSQGSRTRGSRFAEVGGVHKFAFPAFTADIVLVIRRTGPYKASGRPASAAAFARLDRAAAAGADAQAIDKARAALRQMMDE